MNPTPGPPRCSLGERNPSNSLTRQDTHTDSSPEELETETGAACFGPQTLLLVQNPMNQATYDSGKALTRPIESIGHGSFVLAEKQDTKGKSIFFLARLLCVMIFEIPQEGDPEANNSLQAKILSKGPGFTLTKYHHIRKYGSMHEQEPGGRRDIVPAHPTKWGEAADLDAMSRTYHTDIPPKIVSRVFNLVLDPPGNVVILALQDELYISATLGYHMRFEPNLDATYGGGRPVYTRHDALQLQGLPEFSRGLIRW